MVRISIKGQRLIQAVFQALDRLGKPLLIFLDQRIRPLSGDLFCGCQPDHLQLRGKDLLLSLRDVGQDIPHKMDLAPLPGRSWEALLDSLHKARMRVTDDQFR